MTKLNPSQNVGIIEAFEKECHAFNVAKIKTFHHIRKLDIEGISFDSKEQASWNTQLQNEFHILKRTANSIIYEANTIWKMHKEAQSTLLKQYKMKRESLIEEIAELEKKKKRFSLILIGKTPLKKKKVESQADYLAREKEHFERTATKQRKTRSKLVARKKLLDRLNPQIAKLENILKTRNFRLCFGTKKLQSKDPDAFRKRRDSQMSFTGSSDEKCQNGIFQLFWSKSRNQFDLRMKKDFYEKPEVYETRIVTHKDKRTGEVWTEEKKVRKREDKNSAWAIGRCHFSYGQKQIVHALKERSGALSYWIIKKSENYYLYCSFDWKKEGMKNKTPSLNPNLEEDRKIKKVVSILKEKNASAIGVDINKGFLSLSAINSAGGLIHTFDMDYRFKAGNRTESDLAYLCSRIVYLALMSNVPVCIEEINLSAKKYRSRKKGNKVLNSMLHSFSYKKYKKLMTACCFRYGVPLIRVNPAWTSEIARRKYCIPMKLCVHNAAAWMIARRGMGFKDQLPKALTQKEKDRML